MQTFIRAGIATDCVRSETIRGTLFAGQDAGLSGGISGALMGGLLAAGLLLQEYTTPPSANAAAMTSSKKMD